MGYTPEPNAGPSELRIFLGIALPFVLGLMVFTSLATRRPEQNLASGASAADIHSAALGGHIDYVAHPDEAKAEVTRMAKESQGDFLRLTLEDQRWLDGMTAGHGAGLIATEARNLRKTHAIKSGKSAPKNRGIAGGGHRANP